MKKVFFFTLLLATPLAAQVAKRESVALTVYNSNLGVVRDLRTFDLTKGQSEIKLLDVPSQIDPTTLKITAPKHPNDVAILEQNYEYDLVNQEKLLQKYIDKPITVGAGKGKVGTLLSAEANHVTIKTDSGIIMFGANPGQIVVPDLPEGLITRPTLLWNIQSNSQLSHEPLEVLYQTSGISWHAEYIAALSDDDKSLDLSGWVSIDNKCGATFENAKLKLVAGSVNRVANGGFAIKGMRGNQNSETLNEMASPQFSERALFDYHLYDLGRAATIKNNEVKQISLLAANGVKVDKHYTYHGNSSVVVTLELKNSKENNMGMPLPEGVIRIMKKDKDGSSQFIGEDRIGHTPRDEKITVNVGNAFDLTGEQTNTDTKLFNHTSETSTSVTLKNHKEEEVTIDVVESMGGGNWQITKSSIPFEKKNAYEIIFHVPIKPGAEQKFDYTVFISW
jgi:hypothetical protein